MLGYAVHACHAREEADARAAVDDRRPVVGAEDCLVHERGQQAAGEGANPAVAQAMGHPSACGIMLALFLLMCMGRLCCGL